jgi:type IV secretion system protein TrbL
LLGLLLSVGTQMAVAQNATSPILNQYANARGAWFDAIWPFANGLFALLATIEFAWSMAILALERADMQTFLAGFVRKIMWIGAFFTLLTFGPTWIPAIIDSFIDLGAAAGNGGAPLTPSLVFQRGIEIAGRLMDGAGAAMFITNFGASLALVASALLVMLAFVMVTIQFVVAMVESYIVVAAGLIFLGFGGSRWTVPYVERYIALAVAVGVKIMVLYLLIGLGMAVSEGWIESAIAVPEQPSPGMSALEIVGSALIFGMLCWQAPKLVSGLIGGAPSLGAGDALSSAAGPAALAAGGAVLASAAAGSVIARVAAAANAGASRGGPAPAPNGGGGGGGGSGGNGLGVSPAGGRPGGGSASVAPPQPSASTASTAHSGTATTANRAVPPTASGTASAASSRTSASSAAQPSSSIGAGSGSNASTAGQNSTAASAGDSKAGAAASQRESAWRRAQRASADTQRMFDRLTPPDGPPPTPPPMRLSGGDT